MSGCHEQAQLREAVRLCHLAGGAMERRSQPAAPVIATAHEI
jgi:hypothetical protein